jgi:hypothetical protein
MSPLYLCPHTVPLFTCPLLLYMCAHTTIYVCLYCRGPCQHARSSAQRPTDGSSRTSPSRTSITPTPPSPRARQDKTKERKKKKNEEKRRPLPSLLRSLAPALCCSCCCAAAATAATAAAPTAPLQLQQLQRPRLHLPRWAAHPLPWGRLLCVT